MNVPSKTAKLQSLEQATGLTFVYIPAGTYQIGVSKDQAQVVLLNKKSRGDYFTEYFPETQVNLSAFWIATDLLRLSHWRRLQESAFASDLQKVVSPQDTENYKYNWVRDVRWGFDYGFNPVLKDRIETDSPLTLTFEQSTTLAQVIGVRLPSYAEWEVAARGTEHYLFPWGNTFDLSQVKLSNLHYGYTWEDPESTMGFRETEYISGHYCRIDHFGKYTNAVSPFGLKGLMHWGMEWNAVDLANQTIEKLQRNKTTKILRSLLDCGYSRSTANVSDSETENTALNRSNHRAFSGVPLAGFATIATAGKLGAFRFVYSAENDSEVSASEFNPQNFIAEPDWKLYELIGGLDTDAVEYLGEPESKKSYDFSTSVMWSDMIELLYYSKGLSVTTECSYSRLSRPASAEEKATRITQITLYTDTRNTLGNSDDFVTYRRAIFTNVRLGIPRDRLMATAWQSEATLKGIKASFNFDGNDCLTRVVLERETNTRK